MSRDNQKGFLLAESLIVATFVLSLLIFLFVQFKNLSTSYDSGFKYNSVEGLYALDNVKTYLKENASDDKKISSSLAAQSKPYLTIYSDNKCNDSIGLRGTGYCEELMDAQNLKTVIFTDAKISTIKGENKVANKKYLKDWLRATNLSEAEKNDIFTENMKDFILRVNVKEISHTYRLIAEFGDGSFATFNVGDENWSSSKYNDPDYVDPSYNTTATTNSCFKYTTDADGATVTGYTCTDIKNPKIPSEFGGKRVIAIGKDAFKAKGLTSVTIPPGVRTIEQDAFSNNSLTKIDIPVSVLKIGINAFRSNKLTGNLIIPDSVSVVGDGAFASNQLTSVKLGITVNSVGGSAFLSNQLDSVILNDYLYTIGSNAFSGNKLKTITLPETLTSIGDGAFYNNQITEITIPASVNSIGNNAFKETTTWNKDGIDIDGENPYRFNGRWTEIGWPLIALSTGQTFTALGQNVYEVPLDGYYRIDLWGAQGGGSYDVGANKARNNGGKGAYTSGIVELRAGKNLYIYIGAQGSNGEPNKNVGKGNNGGGGASHGKIDSNITDPIIFQASAGGGGSATDVRYASDNLASRIMVAAGGGGGVHTTAGGIAGDLWSPNGAKQTSGNAFGDGKTGSGHGNNYGVPGGGGGYFGGTSSASGSTGGSSYISGYAGSNSRNSGNTSHTNNTKHYSGIYFVQTKMINGGSKMPATDLTGTETGHAGNGYARITYMGNDKPASSRQLTKVRYIKDCINGNTKNIYNHWIEIQAIADGENVARGKTITGSVSATSTKPYSYTVDGNIDNLANYGEANSSGKQCLTIDLGKEYNLEEIGLWHYFGDGRGYKDNVLSVASADKEYRNAFEHHGIGPQETSNGKHFK